MCIRDRRYATPRRSALQEGGDELVAQRTAAQRPNTEMLRKQALANVSNDQQLLWQSDGILRLVTPQVLGRLHLLDDLDFGDHGCSAKLLLPVQPEPQLLAFTSGGRVAALRWEFAAQQPGPLERFLPDSVDGQAEQVVDVLVVPPADQDFSVGLLSSDGRFKRLAGQDLRELSGRATTVLKLSLIHI